jgi:hypothetical protein
VVATATRNAEIERPKDREDEFRVRRGVVRLLSIPEHRFVMVEGSGPPVDEAFQARMGESSSASAGRNGVVG